MPPYQSVFIIEDPKFGTCCPKLAGAAHVLLVVRPVAGRAWFEPRKVGILEQSFVAGSWFPML